MTPWTKRLSIGLIVSVAINLILAGFLLGRGLRHPVAREWGPRGASSVLRARERAPLRGMLKPHREELLSGQSSLRAARRAARTALVNPSFEAAGFASALAALRAETARNQEALHRILVEAASHAGPEERRELARFFDVRQP